MIQVKSLAKRFEDKEVIKGIDATFETGKTNLVIGRSGAGKSVFVKCMIGLIRPDQGEVLYDGRDLIKMTKPELLRLRREMGMLFQGSALFDSMTVVENVLFPMEMFSSDSYDKSYRRAMELLERVGLAEAAKKYPAEISGGMMKRTAIAALWHSIRNTSSATSQTPVLTPRPLRSLTSSSTSSRKSTISRPSSIRTT